MKISFLLIPKADTYYVYDDNSLRQVIEKMEVCQFFAIPVLDRDGHYVCTVNSGDLLWQFKNNPHMTFLDAEKIRLCDIPKRRRIDAVNAGTASIEDVLDKAMGQNFIPVVDDYNIYIGLVRRQDIMQYLSNQKETK